MLHMMKPLPGGSYYVLFKIEHFDGFDPEINGISHFMPVTDSIENSISFAIDKSMGSTCFNLNAINSGFHKLSVRVESDMLNAKQDNADTNNNVMEESISSESETFVNQRRLGKGLLNLGKRTRDDNFQGEGTSRIMQKRRIQDSSDDDMF